MPMAAAESESNLCTEMEALKIGESSKLYPRWPTVHRDCFAFVYDDSLWTASHGVAARLSAGVEQVRRPLFSPDGRSIAYSLVEDGCEEIYRAGSDGSSPTRLTFTGANCRVSGWSQDGSAIFFASEWRQYLGCALFSVPATGGTPTQLPFGKDADSIAVSPSGTGMLLGRHCGDPAVAEWKRFSREPS